MGVGGSCGQFLSATCTPSPRMSEQHLDLQNHSTSNQYYRNMVAAPLRLLLAGRKNFPLWQKGYKASSPPGPAAYVKKMAHLGGGRRRGRWCSRRAPPRTRPRKRCRRRGSHHCHRIRIQSLLQSAFRAHHIRSRWRLLGN